MKAIERIAMKPKRKLSDAAEVKRATNVVRGAEERNMIILKKTGN
jgi:hypothetical protein